MIRSAKEEKIENVSSENEKIYNMFWPGNQLQRLVTWCTGLLILLFLGTKNFVIFHSMVELICVAIALMTAGIAMETYHYNKNNQLVLLGVAYGFVGGFYLIHAVVSQGNTFLVNTENLSTQLWIIGRFFESISLLFIGIIGSSGYLKKYKLKHVVALYFFASLFVLIMLLYLKIFPDSYVPGIGQTNFKKISELVSILVIVIGLSFLHKKKSQMTKRVFVFLRLSFICTIFSGVLFLQYFLFTDMTNIIGHLFKLISFYFIYKAVIETTVREPYIKLYNSEQMKTNLINKLPIGVFIQDKTKLVYANPRFAQIIGAKEPEEIVGKSIFEIIHEDYHLTVKNRIEQMIEGITTDVVEEKYITVENEIVDVEITAIHYPYESEYATLAIVQDISQRKALESLEKKVEDREKQLNEVERYDQIKTEFFSNISHELRTPLNIILGIVQLLINSHDNIVEKCPYVDTFYRHSKTMKQNCFRLLKLINNFIDLTKLDSGFMKINLSYYNIVNVIEEITLSIVSFAESKGINIIFDTDVEEKIVACDVDKIERIMLNLFSNAIKFVEPGGAIEVSMLDKGESILISVKDTGRGIPKDKLEVIFERFTQAESLLTRRAEGSGIGLSLVRSFVELHGGTINVKSEVGIGTEFIIELPIGFDEGIDVNNEVAIASEMNVERISVEFSDIYS